MEGKAMPMRWIHDRSIVVKNALAPAVVLLVLALTVTGVLVVLGQQQEAIDTIRTAGARQLRGTELSADLARTHAMLYRLTAQGTNATNVDRKSTRLNSSH